MLADFKRYKIMIYLLVFQLLGLPVPVLAKTKIEEKSVEEKAATAQDPNTGQSLAVVPVGTAETDGESLEKIADRIRDSLSNQGKYEVLTKKKTDVFFADNPNLLAQTKAPVTLDRYLEDAKKFYVEFAYKEGIGLLQNTIEAFYNTGSLQKQTFVLREAHLILGNIYTADEDKRKAIQTFKEAIRLDPDYKIDSIVYPPATVANFDQAKEEYLKELKPTKLEISTSPSEAEVYVNGVFKGNSPVVLENYSPGTHFILVKKPEHETVAVKLQVTQDTKEKIELKKKVQPQVDLHGLKVAQLKDIPELVRLGSVVGEGLGVQKVVLVSLEEVGWHHRVTTRMIDIKYRASHKHSMVEVLDLPKDSLTAAKVLAEDLNKLSDVDLAKDPKKYAESDVVVIGTKRKKSLLKSPLMWSLVGLLVAGGATSAVLLTRDGEGSASENPNISSGFGGSIGKF
ncbi:MAG: PEGA domain-containing protein [Deltaproteobacteria bacterium]|nr:PEGA domain-containing protein [Deltaproteobacteria bacterium]